MRPNFIIAGGDKFRRSEELAAVHAPENRNIAGFDQDMMRRCNEIAVQSGRNGEYPYGAVIPQAG